MELYVSNISLLIYEGTLGELETYNYYFLLDKCERILQQNAKASRIFLTKIKSTYGYLMVNI